jgi:hypothetical protein
VPFEHIGVFVLVTLAWSSLFYVASSWGEHLDRPAAIFIAVNGASLSLYELALLEYEPLSAVTYSVAALGLITAAIAGRFFTGTDGPARIGALPMPIARGSASADAEAVVASRAFFAIGLFATGTWIYQVLQFSAAGLLVQAIAAPAILQEGFQQQYVGYLNLGGSLCFPLWVYSRTMRTLPATRLLAFGEYMVLVSVTLGMLLAGIKTYIMSAIIMGVMAWVVLHRDERARIFRVGLGLVTVLIGLMVAYDAFIDIFVKTHFPGSQFPEWASSLERPYLYITGGWPATELVAKYDIEQPIFGYIALQPVWKLLGWFGLVVPPPEYAMYVDIGPEFHNARPVLGALYWDGGFPGVVVGTMVLIAIATWLHRRATELRDCLSIVSYAIFAYGVVISFFVYHFRFNMAFAFAYASAMIWLVRRMPAAPHRGLSG